MAAHKFYANSDQGCAKQRVVIIRLPYFFRPTIRSLLGPHDAWGARQTANRDAGSIIADSPTVASPANTEYGRWFRVQSLGNPLPDVKLPLLKLVLRLDLGSSPDVDTGPEIHKRNLKLISYSTESESYPRLEHHRLTGRRAGGLQPMRGVGAVGHGRAALPAADGVLAHRKRADEMGDRLVRFLDGTADLRGRGCVGVQADVR